MLVSLNNKRQTITGASVTELSKSGGNAVEHIVGVGEGRSVLCAPRELRAEAGVHTIFDEIFWGQVTDLLAGGSDSVQTGGVLLQLEH